jgi:cell division protein FtsX
MTHPFRTLIAVVVLLSCCVSARSQTLDDARFRRDVAALAGFGSRVPGTPGFEKARDYLREQLRQIPGVELQEHRFRLVAPVTQTASLTLPGGREVPVHPLWPANVRTVSTPPEGITGRLVYCGDASYGAIPPRDIAGQIAVIEATSGENWPNAHYFGASAVLLLGDPAVSHVDLRHHELFVPVNIPRFYVPAGELADQLRANALDGEATVRANVSWKSIEVSNFYALLARPEVKGPAITLSARYDSSGLVPDLAVGASQAVQTAAGLELLRSFAANPPARPVLLFLGGGDGLQFLSTRQMLMALAEAPVKWNDELSTIAIEQASLQRDLARANALGGNPTTLDPSRDRDLIDRIVQVLEVDVSLEQDQLFKLRLLTPEELDDAMRVRIRELEDRQVLLNQLKFAYQQKPRDLANGSFGAMPAEYLRRTIVRMAGGELDGKQTPGLIAQNAARDAELKRRIELYYWMAQRLDRNTNLRERDSGDRLIDVLIGIDLSDRGVRFGPLFWGMYLRNNSLQLIQTHRDYFNRIDPRSRTQSPPEWLAAIKPLVDFEPLTQSRSPQSFLAAPLAIPSEMASTWGVPGFTLLTLDDLRLVRDTPNDTLERLNLDAISPQLAAMQVLLRNAIDDPRFRSDPEYKRQRTSFGGQVVGAAAGRPVPDLPRDGFLVTYMFPQGGRIPRPRGMPWSLGVRRIEVVECDAAGNYRFEGLTRLAGDMHGVAVKVYGFDPASGAITHSSDVGRQSSDLKTTVDVRQEINPVRSLIFNCTEFTLTNLYDPRFLQALGEVIFMDARRNTNPQRFDYILHNKMMAGFIEPGARVLMLFRYGRVGNRLVLLNMLTPAEAAAQAAAQRGSSNPGARGFTIQELRNIGPLSMVTARDFNRLDAQRLEEYRRNGVFSGLLDTLHAQASQQLEDAKAAFAANDGNALMRASTGAWANEARVYSAAAAMANDVINAAIFLLLLCVPFAFCMERLLIASPSIYRQIAGMLGIFAVMTAVLWTFHPAFKISSSPLIIILAFAIILMSVVVIWVVYQKFDTELRRLRSGKGNATSTSFARASVLASAVQLGIANMRRRKFRTTLTALTVVLITFAVLCFTSTSRYIETTTLPTGVPTEGNHGLLLRQRGFRPMTPDVLDTLATIYPQKQFVQRWWNLSAGDPKENVHLVAGGLTIDGKPPRIVAAAAALGLSPGESRVSAIDEVIGAGKFARLENGEGNVIYLSTQMAEQLEVKEGDWLRIGGVDVVLAGTYDANEFEQRVLMLSGEPIAPLRYPSGLLDAGGKRLDAVDADTLSLDADQVGAEVDMAYEHLSPSQIVIIPATLSQQLHNGTLRGVAVRLKDEAEVKQVSDELTRRFSLATFAGFDDGVKLVAASDLADVRGFQVAIPLAVGGLIIFNTMMGSIAERRREIHVYTSLGLAPLHVGALFVAEAMTYGLIGAVFGYVIGQGVGTVLQSLGWLGNATLNYSGTSAMLTMGLILLVVLLSALVPARLASKIAAPSIDRTWKVPPPVGDQIVAQLPFTINKTAADGALAYLADFFEAHQEGSIGKFSAGKVEPFAMAEKDGSNARGIKTIIWLTPFDLGVRQHLMLLIHPGEFPDIYEVQVILQRLSGDDGSWYRMNRTFLTELRKQFLQWRSLSPEHMLRYVEESRKLFNEIPDRVVTTTVGEQVRLG